MRRMLLVLMAMVLLVPAGAFGGTDFHAEGTSDYGVSFWDGKGVRQFSIMAWPGGIEVTLYLDSVVLDTVLLPAWFSWEPTILCDSIYVNRTTTTAVLCDWNEFLSRDVASARKSYARPDPTGPEPRTASQTVLISQYSTSAPTATLANCIGAPVSGARSLVLDIEWDATTTDFAFEYMFGISAGDSTFNKFGVVNGAIVACGLDTLHVDESDWPDDHFTLDIPLGGSVAGGYFFIRIHAGSVVEALDATLLGVW